MWSVFGAHSPDARGTWGEGEGEGSRAKLTFLRLFEAVVLGQPLGVRHEHVVSELRVLLHQQESLTNRQVKGRGEGGGRGERGEDGDVTRV